jgi:hypothetical protein
MAANDRIVIQIDYFTNKRVFIETTRAKWEELTRDVVVSGDRYVDGRDNYLDQDRMARIVDGVEPGFKLIEKYSYIHYLISYSSNITWSR